MLDLKYVLDNMDEVIKRLNTRNGDYSYLRELNNLSEERKEIIKKSEDLKNKRNEAAKLIGQLKREGKDASHIKADFKDEIQALDEKVNALEKQMKDILLRTPNLPDLVVPLGKDDQENKEIRKWGTIREFNFPIKDHVELGEKLGILDFTRAAKITGSRFVVDKGLGARLERALINYMIDLHTSEHGYEELIPPYIVNEDSMYGTGQFPKFKEDSFKLEGFPWYLNPTAEVPTINLYRDEIMPVEMLTKKYVSYTTAFRSEAGSAGRDTKGILRQHQFNKVELIKFTKPEDSDDELEKMLKDSESVLQKLNIPYRVVLLSTGDLGFSMRKTYDIEVWLPGQNMYREIGSISNAGDYQARRANIRFRRDKNSKPEYVHTLNGSGLAVGRTLIAVLENYQNEDGTVTIPEVLRRYMGVDIIK